MRSCYALRVTHYGLRVTHRALRLPLHHPLHVEVRVLDRLPHRAALGVLLRFVLRGEMAVRRVQRAVLRLDEGRVMKLRGALAAGLRLEVPFPLPRPALIVRDRDGEAVAALLRVVVDQGPAAVV